MLVKKRYNHLHNTLKLLMAEQIFLSPQVKQNVSISNKQLSHASCRTT